MVVISSLLILFTVDTLGSFRIQRNSIMNGFRAVNKPKTAELNMMFDFFRQRTQEGFDQVKNIASKTMEGKLSEALRDSADYIRERNRIDSENLKQLTLGMTRSRDRLLKGIFDSFTDDADVASTLLKLEDVLLQADIGVSTTTVIIDDLREYAKREGLKVDDILPVLRARLVEALTPPALSRGLIFAPPDEGPTVIFVIGANGMGKTTTIGKIASRLKNELGMTVLLGACDTFRAAAVEQLAEWAKRANVSIEVPFEAERGGDPVPVVTRSVQRAKRERYDVVIIDTSGRLSNNFELTMQLQGMKKAIQAEIPAGPHETLLVVDGSLGRNAVEQAAAWRKYVGVSGLVITKLDGTARGGFVVSVVKDLELPVKFIGIGEKISDLRDFQAELFVDALLGNDMETSEKLKNRMAKMMNLSSSVQATEAGSGSRTSSQISARENVDPAERLRAAFASSASDAVGDSSNEKALIPSRGTGGSKGASGGSKKEKTGKTKNGKKK